MTLAEIIATRGLSRGAHAGPEGRCCAVEAQALARGLPITDDAASIRVLPVVPLNDSTAWRDDAHRTAHLGPVLLAIDGWHAWPVARQVRFAQLLAAGTNERVLPIVREAARAAKAAKAAKAAAAAAADWAANATSDLGQALRQEMLHSATWSSWSAAGDAARVASAVESAAAIETACAVWLRAAEESK